MFGFAAIDALYFYFDIFFFLLQYLIRKTCDFHTKRLESFIEIVYNIIRNYSYS